MTSSKNEIKYEGCLGCEHFHADGTCEAFPERIPLSIVSGDVEHTKPLRRQKNNIVFEPVTPETKEKLRIEINNLIATASEEE